MSECPELTMEEIGELEQSVRQNDWREELIGKLKIGVRTLNFTEIAPGLGAVIRGDTLVVQYMGREFSISQEGDIAASGRITPWAKILLLHYLRTHGSAPLTGKWVSYRDLKSGMVKASSFLRECEDPLRGILDRDLPAVLDILKQLGAETVKDTATRFAWRLYLLPKLPVMILYWPREDEFESKVSILFDSTADQFLDVESLMFLGEGLIDNIEVCLQNGG